MHDVLSQLLDSAGKRLYMTSDERRAFLAASEKQKREVRTLCLVLAYTGCRISEALELTPDRIDLEGGGITFRSLKKRKDKKTGMPKTIFRKVPAPPHVLDALNLVHNVREKQHDKRRKKKLSLWSWSRTTAWRQITSIMESAGIADGPHRSPKGLRHSFGVNAIEKGVQLNMLQKWMGHTDMKTTAIYANAMGAEEQNIAAKMWT